MPEKSDALDPVIVRAKIRDLIDEFFSRVDRGESVADLLTEDARFETPQRNATGRAAFAELLLNLFKERKDIERTARHFSSNVTVVDLGEGRYRARSLVTVISKFGATEVKGILNLGDHDDIIELDEAGTCRFAVRTMSPVLQLGLTAVDPGR